jgi:hypothetical protein
MAALLEPLWRPVFAWIGGLRLPRMTLARHLIITSALVGAVIWWLL